MFFKSRCYNGGKQHKFEPRYSTRDFIPQNLLDGGISFKGDATTLRRREVIYEGDVCVWCGRIVKEKQDA
jgi:hypothetical protein